MLINKKSEDTNDNISFGEFWLQNPIIKVTFIVKTSHVEVLPALASPWNPPQIRAWWNWQPARVCQLAKRNVDTCTGTSLIGNFCSEQRSVLKHSCQSRHYSGFPCRQAVQRDFFEGQWSWMIIWIVKLNKEYRSAYIFLGRDIVRLLLWHITTIFAM